MISAGETQIQEITFRGQELESVHSYKYLGQILSSEASMKRNGSRKSYQSKTRILCCKAGRKLKEIVYRALDVTSLNIWGMPT